MRKPLQHLGTEVRKSTRSRLYFLAVTLALLFPVFGYPQAAGVNQGGPDYLHAPAGLNPPAATRQ